MKVFKPQICLFAKCLVAEQDSSLYINISILNEGGACKYVFSGATYFKGHLTPIGDSLYYNCPEEKNDLRLAIRILQEGLLLDRTNLNVLTFDGKEWSADDYVEYVNNWEVFKNKENG